MPGRKHARHTFQSVWKVENDTVPNIPIVVKDWIPLSLLKTSSVDSSKPTYIIDTELIRTQPNHWSMLKMGSINTPILVAVVSCPQDPESRIRRRPVCVWYLWKWGYEAREDDDFVKRKYWEDRNTQNWNTEELHLGVVIFQKLVWKEKPFKKRVCITWTPWMRERWCSMSGDSGTPQE
jgi:hypothetical protein